MTDSSSDINVKIDEYHLMIEEVLGGMDIMLTRLNERISVVENTLGIPKTKSLEVSKNDIDLLREEMSKLKGEMMAGFDLAFTKIHDHN